MSAPMQKLCSATAIVSSLPPRPPALLSKGRKYRAASVPLALSKLIERREVASGSPVLLFGFGGGLTYAGQVIRCP